MYIWCYCYMIGPHMGHHQATVIIWVDHCTVHFVLSTVRNIVVVVVVNLLRRIFSSYRLDGRRFRAEGFDYFHNIQSSSWDHLFFLLDFTATEVTIKRNSFWDVLPCNRVEVQESFVWTYCLHLEFSVVSWSVYLRFLRCGQHVPQKGRRISTRQHRVTFQ
jgi:hypothetical protein